MHRCLWIWTVCLSARIIQTGADGIISDNSPPVLRLDRAWTVQASEGVGSVVTRVQAEDAEGDPLAFGLEHDEDDPHKNPLPFTIDSRTGHVSVNDSLADWVNRTVSLYVTVTDGKLTVKTEVFAQIVNATGGAWRPRPGVGGGGGGGGGGPPGLPAGAPSLPGGFSAPPLPGLARPPRPPHGQPPQPPFPHFNHPVFKPRPSPPPPPPHAATGGGQPTTKLVTVPYPPSTTGVSGFSSSRPNGSTPTRPAVPAASPAPPPSHPAAPPASPPASPAPPTSTPAARPVLPANGTAGAAGPDVTATVAPIAAVLAVFLVAGGAVFLFRRRLCRLGAKTSKDDMRKEPSGGLVLEEPTALRHWRGPRAHSNRYEGWERDSNAQQASVAGGAVGSASTACSVDGKPSDRWEFPRHRLKVFNILGEGCFGQVWRCEALDIDGQEGPTVVAVKTLKENATEKERADLQQELQVMKMLDPHPNVVRLLGCCTEKDPLFVIMEFVALGKLQSFLRSSRAERCYGNLHGASASLTSRDLTSCAYQVARGMDFLSSKGIIHRDLAARNVLVGEGHVCKVADFGFARDVIASHVYERKSEGRLPIRWMAPESLYDNIFSVKSDVWSFGVLMWEVVTLGSTPYPGLAAAEVMRRVRDGYRLDKPEHCRRELYNIMYYCWDKDPQERPSFRELVALLEPLLMTETDYIELERFPDHSYYNMVSLSGEKL
ncbi:hypothetical protein R5R35_005754 [Gryllus longicercus]|uniref:receptor protein-tyrosine kinase n=1 Tax=Gryllus longicercus TaxID=2509291 RepID=A0AAN9WD92_9ORTH